MVATRTHEVDAPDWAAIVIVILSVTAFAVAQGLTFPLISLVLERRGVAGSLIGLNAAAYATGAIVAVLWIDQLTARFRGNRLIVAALFICSISLATFATIDYLPIWFIARFLIGFCASLISILSGAWLNTASPDRIRGRISGFYGAGMCAGFAIGPLAIPLVGTSNGSAFALVAGYIALIGFACAAFTGSTRTSPERAPAGALLRFISAAPILVLIELAFGFADIAAISGMAVYFVRVGHSEAFAAYAITVLSLPTAFAQPLVGWLLDKTSRAGVTICCGLVGAVAFLAIPFLQSEAAILVVFAIIGVATFALSTCALTILGERFEGGMLVAGTASFSLAYSIGSVMGSTGTGSLMDWISPRAVPISVGLGLLAFTILVSFKRP
ncbi:MFS transporter [Mesorhizobium sp. LSJC264A00]|uniref:MFS transporter n=1 Tax=unclassified Mesorhizobium TaxID=325217 RepID=UPI0003CE203B|nr:MFS transporter [Mesorhizobium sp. LSJC264A00]ESX26814.1 MFS transporter [Mesorhizobium sp. LSJC264A00]